MMATFTARVEYIDRRTITIEADTLEEAEARYAVGNWDSEDTYDFFSNREIKPLCEAKERT